MSPRRSSHFDPPARVLTAREQAAQLALVDAATEIACIVGSSLAPSLIDLMRDPKERRNLAPVLARLYDANDEWQEAQLQAAGCRS